MQTEYHRRAYEATNIDEVQFRDTGLAEVKPRGQLAAAHVCQYPPVTNSSLFMPDSA